MRAWIAIAAGVAAIAGLTGCGADRVTITPTAAPPAPVVRPTPSCDGTVASMPWANFAAAFNAGHTDQAAAQFGGHHDFAWWDPSDDPSGGLQTLDELRSHFADLYRLGVRLPETVYLTPPAGEAPGEGGFQFNDGQGFSGKGAIECQTAKIAYLVIDTWTPKIAGGAPVGEPFAPASP